MSTIKHLLPEDKTYFKANLHTHSTISDGKHTPEEMKALYQAAGYSIVALTDHNVVADRQDLTDENFVLLAGMEVDITEGFYYSNGRRYMGKSRHLGFIAKHPHNLWVPFEKMEASETAQVFLDRSRCGSLENLYTAPHINELIKQANQEGFFVIYNHPCWSLETYPDYAPMKGLWGMEYRNSGSIAMGFDENNGHIYQDFSLLNNRMVPIMADDMHTAINSNGYPELGSSWNMIGADILTYEAVVDAMEKGCLYGSCGPEIHNLTWDGSKLHISCSPVLKIQVITQTRNAVLCYANDGNLLTEATFDMSVWVSRSSVLPVSFLRLLITAPDGSYAVTRAYFLDELV